MKRKNRT